MRAKGRNHKTKQKMVDGGHPHTQKEKATANMYLNPRKSVPVVELY